MYPQKLDKQLHQRLSLFLILSVLLAAYVGARMPSMWSINYYIPSFFDGFYRRGLLGTLLYPFGALRLNYTFISSIQLAVLGCLLLYIFLYAYRAPIRSKILIILFFLAPTGGYLFHITGYSDHLLYLLLFITLICRNAWINLLLMTAALFIHEAALFTVIPIYLVSLLIQRANLQQIGIHLLVLGGVFLVITLFWQTVPLVKIETMLKQIIEHFGPFARLDYYSTFHNEYTTAAITNTFIDLQGVVALPPRGSYELLYFEISLLMINAFLIAKLYCPSDDPCVYERLCNIVVWSACLSPLVLIFFGSDSSRWVFLSYASSIILFCMLEKNVSNVQFFSIVFVFLLFLAYGKLWYFDGCAQKSLYWPQLKALF